MEKHLEKFEKEKERQSEDQKRHHLELLDA